MKAATGIPIKRIALRELAKVIRSKNAGPYLITVDVIFSNKEVFECVKKSGALNQRTLASAYNLSPDAIVSGYIFEPGLAFKFTIKRQFVQGSIGDSDIFGAQQHVPLLDIYIPIPSGVGDNEKNDP